MAFPEVPQVDDFDDKPRARRFSQIVMLILNSLLQLGYIQRTAQGQFIIPGAVPVAPPIAGTYTVASLNTITIDQYGRIIAKT